MPMNMIGTLSGRSHRDRSKLGIKIFNACRCDWVPLSEIFAICRGERRSARACLDNMESVGVLLKREEVRVSGKTVTVFKVNPEVFR